MFLQTDDCDLEIKTGRQNHPFLMVPWLAFELLYLMIFVVIQVSQGQNTDSLGFLPGALFFVFMMLATIMPNVYMASTDGIKTGVARFYIQRSLFSRSIVARIQTSKNPFYLNPFLFAKAQIERAGRDDYGEYVMLKGKILFPIKVYLREQDVKAAIAKLAEQEKI